jgi:hypothetical protein
MVPLRGEARVSDYRIYCLSTKGKIIRAEDRVAPDDQAVVHFVQAQANATDCEIWQGKRKVATVPAGGGEAIYADVG